MLSSNITPSGQGAHCFSYFSVACLHDVCEGTLDSCRTVAKYSKPGTHYEKWILLLLQDLFAELHMMYLLRTWFYLVVQTQVNSSVDKFLTASIHFHWLSYLHPQSAELAGQLSPEDRIDAPGSKAVLGLKGACLQVSRPATKNPHSIGHLSLNQSFCLIQQSTCHGCSFLGLICGYLQTCRSLIRAAWNESQNGPFKWLEIQKMILSVAFFFFLAPSLCYDKICNLNPYSKVFSPRITTPWEGPSKYTI